MEFVTTATQLPVIATNFEEVKKYIESKRDMYKGIIVTEDTLKESRADLSDLIKIRTSIDAFRKAKKKEMLVPITAFENQCKELLAIEAEAETPLAAGINKFDEERRQKKKEQAEKFIQEAITAKGLNAKYATRMEMKDSYLLLTATQKSIKAEIEREADVLLSLQNTEEQNIALITDTVNKENEDLLTALNASEFIALIDQKAVGDILTLISHRASDIREAQRLAEEKARKAAEEAKLAEERARKAAEETKVETPPVVAQTQTQTYPQMGGTGASNFSQTGNFQTNQPTYAPQQIPAVSQSKEQWSVTFSVNGTFAQIKELCDIIKNKQIVYSVLEQKRV